MNVHLLPREALYVNCRVTASSAGEACNKEFKVLPSSFTMLMNDESNI